MSDCKTFLDGWRGFGAGRRLDGRSTAIAQPLDITKLRDELMALEKGSWDFMRDKNYEAMRDFLADDGLLIFRDGNALQQARRGWS